ncbi:MAG: FAD-binding protein [Gemmatimonadota bacterium]|nr:FAD-binding protein [Gemmatimonadota bacterium]
MARRAGGAPGRAVSAAALVAERVRDAAARGTRLRVRAGGAWMDANRPVAADAELPLDGCTGIVEYVPGDLTLTARAATTLGEIADAARAHRQWLALDPFGPDAGTIGATVATGSYGPLAAAYGTPRDQLLGVEFANGAGDLVRAGGRVVKNVAGFDLVRLMAGAWGTLGVITEVTVRLRALPAGDETLALVMDDGGPALDRLGPRLRALATPPLAAELVDGALARRLGLPERPTLLLRIGGNAESMRAQRDAIAALGAAAPVDGTVWSAMRAAGEAGDAVWRISRGPARFAESWRDAADRLAPLPGARVQGSPLRGVVRCAVPRAAAPALAHALARPAGGTLVAETLPADAWAAMPCMVDDRLSRGVRAAFDPARILNPGILGEAA